MKKAKQDQPRQSRRARALDRFKIDPTRQNDTEYVARKNRELESLQRALGR